METENAGNRRVWGEGRGERWETEIGVGREYIYLLWNFA